LKVQLEGGLNVSGSLGMVKLMMASGYKLQVAVPLERAFRD
jgi:hypothetical protein